MTQAVIHGMLFAFIYLVLQKSQRMFEGRGEALFSATISNLLLCLSVVSFMVCPPRNHTNRGAPLSHHVAAILVLNTSWTEELNADVVVVQSKGRTGSQRSVSHVSLSYCSGPQTATK